MKLCGPAATLGLAVALVVITEVLGRNGEKRKRFGFTTKKYENTHPTDKVRTPTPSSSVEAPKQSPHHGIEKAILESRENEAFEQFDEKRAWVRSRMRLLNILPLSIRWKLKLAFGVGWAYLTSAGGREVADCLETALEIIPGETKPRIKTAPVEVNLPKNMGYMCMSSGELKGLRSLRMTRPVKVDEKNGVSLVDLEIAFDRVKLHADACAIFKKVSPCRVEFGQAVFNIKFKLREVHSMIRLGWALLTDKCVMAIEDVQLVKVKDFKMEPITRDKKSKKWKPSLRGGLVKLFSGISDELVKSFINQIARTHLFFKLKHKHGHMCYDQEFKHKVHRKYQGYLNYLESKRITKELSKKYERTCGKLAPIWDGNIHEEDVWEKDIDLLPEGLLVAADDTSD